MRKKNISMELGNTMTGIPGVVSFCLTAGHLVTLQSTELVRKAKAKLSILHPCADKGKAWYLLGSLLVSVGKLPARPWHGQGEVGKTDGVQCRSLAPLWIHSHSIFPALPLCNFPHL